MSNKIKKAYQTETEIQPVPPVPLPFPKQNAPPNNGQDELKMLIAVLQESVDEMKSLSDEDINAEIHELFPNFMKKILSNVK